jgi:hypothetical protein
MNDIEWTLVLYQAQQLNNSPQIGERGYLTSDL